MGTRRRGLVIVLTGDGKGKTTSAFGQALRAAGTGMSVSIIQFIKGAWRTGEVDALERSGLPITVERTGLGFTIERLRDPRIPMDDHRRAAVDGLSLARERLTSGRYGLVVLDEILGTIAAGLLTEGDVLALLAKRPSGVHVILTGRDAPPALIAAADLVSEVRAVKHHHAAGIAAQGGIEF